jgi:regulator of protease activity HflC (stomatin/prohibitin superfamily)
MSSKIGTEFDLRSVLAHTTLWVVSLVLCVAPLLAIDKVGGTHLLRLWQAYGIWWVIVWSIGSNLVISVAIRRFGTPRWERLSVLLWALSTVLHYAPFLIALAVLASESSDAFGSSSAYLVQIGWLLYAPLALFVTASFTTPLRLRIVLGANRLLWPFSLVFLFLVMVVAPFWLSPPSSLEGVHSYFLWWERYRRWWVLIALLSLFVYGGRSLPFSVRPWLAEHRIAIRIALFFGAFFLLCLIPYVVVIVQSGDAGVLYSPLAGGTQTDRTFSEGSHLKWPWDQMYIYNVRISQVQAHYDVLSSNGLTVGVTTSIRYHPRLNLLGLLQKEVGPDYAEKIVIPQVQSLVRRVFGQYTPEEIYTTKRQIIETTLQAAVQEVGENYVTLDALLVLSIELPPTVQNAIQSKLVQQQLSEEMKFRIARETQEKERKLIEAEGIYRYNQKVRESLQSTDGNDVYSFLKFKGIDATVELAKSPNSKVIVVGASDRMPLIMDAGSMPATSLLPSTSPTPGSSPTLPAIGTVEPGPGNSPKPAQNAEEPNRTPGSP